MLPIDALIRLGVGLDDFQRIFLLHYHFGILKASWDLMIMQHLLQ